MGDEEKLPEWLPSDWSMEVRMRKDGRSYKCFKDPTSDLKFYSKPNVLRHLKNISVKHSKSKNAKRKSTNKHNKSATYAAKTSVAERLPSGWIEEIKVRKKRGHGNRVDKFYTEPESGRVFRSMKEVSRYLETGELGRSTVKSQDKGHVDEEPSSHTSSTRAEYEKKSVPKSKTSKKIHKDQAVKSAAEGERVEITESKGKKEVHKNLDRKSSAEREGDNNPNSKGAGDERDKVPKRRKNKEVAKIQDLKSSSEGGGERESVPESKPDEEVVKDQGLKSGAEGEGDRVPNNQDAGDGRDKMPKRRKTNEVVKDQDLKLSVEIEGGETNCRARQVASKQLSETVDISKNIKDLNSSDTHMVEVQKGSGSDVKHQGPVLLPAGYLPLSQDLVKSLGTSKRDEDVAVPLDSSSKDFLNDPCIEFAIQTLTGTVPIRDDKVHNPGCSASNANPASSLALWTDPCFEFAVKTLTGEIPLEDDSCIKTLFQQPLNSSQVQRHNGLSSTTVKSDSFTSVNNLFTHFGTADKPLYRQQNLVAPAVSRIPNGSS